MLGATCRASGLRPPAFLARVGGENLEVNQGTFFVLLLPQSLGVCEAIRQGWAAAIDREDMKILCLDSAIINYSLRSLLHTICIQHIILRVCAAVERNLNLLTAKCQRE